MKVSEKDWMLVLEDIRNIQKRLSFLEQDQIHNIPIEEIKPVQEDGTPLPTYRKLFKKVENQGKALKQIQALRHVERLKMKDLRRENKLLRERNKQLERNQAGESVEATKIPECQ